MLRQFAEAKPSELIPILDLIPIPICVTDSAGIFVKVNQAYCDFYGYTSEELIGSSFLRVVPEDFRTQMQQLHDEFMSNRYEMLGKWEVLDKDGNLRTILSKAAYVPENSHLGACKMTFLVEIDQGQRALQELQETVNLLEQKLSALEVAQQLSNHDMRNNLASILQMVEVLLDKQPSETQKVWLEHLRNRSAQTLEMLNTSLDYAQMERGKYSPKSETFDLVQLIKNEFFELQKVIGQKSVSLSVSCGAHSLSDEVVKVKADKFYMQRMFHNLLLNAVEASEANQEILVTLEHNGFFKITVHNHGAIPAGVREHFFEKFVTSGKKKGTGLGTYLAKLIVEMHQGTITYRSSEEYGTDIIILLPDKVLLK
jgi:PAS domain S-box-containing protein